MKYKIGDIVAVKRTPDNAIYFDTRITGVYRESKSYDVRSFDYPVFEDEIIDNSKVLEFLSK